jgi:hypothetical protein
MSGVGTGHGDDWDDARIAAAYGALAARASSSGLADSVAGAIREPIARAGSSPDGAPTRSKPALEEVGGVTRRFATLRAVPRARPVRAWIALAATLAIVAVGVGLGVVGRFPSVDLGGLHHFKSEGIEFDYPASWSIHDQLPPTTGFGSTWAILGTHAWPASCGASDINCYYEAKLEPGTIAVEVGLLAMPQSDFDLCTRGASGSDLQGRGPDDPLATRTLTRVDGRPALRTRYDVGGKDYYGSDEWQDWDIAAVGTVHEAYTIHALFRGPGTDALQADLDRLIASIRLTPAMGGQGPADCGAPFPPVGLRDATPSPTSSTTTHVDTEGIALDYPKAWTPLAPTLEPGQQGTPILRVSSGRTPGGSSVVVSVTLVDWPAGSPFVNGPPDAHLDTSNGIPVRSITNLVTNVRSLDLLVPGSSDRTYQILASFSGPADDSLDRSVNALAYGARLHATLTPLPYPTDPTLLDGLLLEGQAELDRAPDNSPEDAALTVCIPFHSGGAVDMSIQLPGTAAAPAGRLLAVHCTVTVARSPAELWRITFDVSWAGSVGRVAGHRQYVFYLDTQANLAGRILRSGDPVPDR